MSPGQNGLHRDATWHSRLSDGTCVGEVDGLTEGAFGLQELTQGWCIMGTGGWTKVK